MHPILPGYRLTQELYRSSRAIVFRATREADQRSVVIKLPSHAAPEPEDLARLRREHALLSAIDAPGVIRVLGLESCQHRLALVMEDCDASPLAIQLQPDTPMPLEQFFPLAVACARALVDLHAHAIHRALNPSNILWDNQTGTLRLIDFGLATRVDGGLAPEDGSVGDLAYMAPEQSGRLNRAADLRADYYALGVTFYRLLTGRLPFNAADPMAWVHCHLTQLPAPLETLNPEVPTTLGALVLKLLAKDPDDRYQSAHGLAWDLAACADEWRETGAITPFPLGRKDASARFEVAHRLFGREVETRLCLDALDSVVSGKAALVTVAGRAGIGKSALVNGLGPAIADRGGRFLVGKCDQYQRRTPYAAVSQALDVLVRQLLAEPEAQLAHWRCRLQEGLGPNARIAVDLVPLLGRVIGEPPPAVQLNPTEEQNRFLTTIQSLIAIFARPAHPLVLFLDDLQWSDTPTLGLVRTLLESHEANALLVICAFRADELQPGDPLTQALEALTGHPRVTRLELAPLDEEDLNRIVAETLQARSEDTQALGALLHRQTEGNPLFCASLLRALHDDALVAFNHDTGRWTWDLLGVERATIPEDLVEFMLGRIQRLPAETQALLRQAACIGNTFEVSMLASLAAAPVSAIVEGLQAAIAAGLVAPAKDWSRFLHDRIRQAAYAMNAEGERQELHLRIGRLMLAENVVPARGASEIAEQLNEGRALIAEASERRVLQELNLAAGRKAKAAAAYRPALEFTRVAHELLPPGAWESDYRQAFETFKLHASCAQLSGEVALSAALYAELLGHTRGPIEKAEVRAMRAAQYIFASQVAAGVAEGIEALALLGIRLSPKPSMAVVAGELLRFKARMRGRRAAALEHAPEATDRRVRLAMEILGDFVAAAYLSGNETLFATIVLKQANLSLAHGNSEQSPMAYSSCAVLLAGLGDFAAAYEFGQLALRLSTRFGGVDSRCRALVLYGLFSHSWSQPWQMLDAWFRESVEAGLQSGDYLFMAFACGYVNLWDPQVDLETAIHEGRGYLALCRTTTYQNAIDAATCHQQLRLALCGRTAGPLALGDAEFDEAECLARMARNHYVSGLAIFHTAKLQLACILGEREEAWQALLASEAVIKALTGSPYMVDYCVFGFQAAARQASTPGPQAGQARRRLRRFLAMARGWARHCPGNFLLHVRLMEAELAALQGRARQATARYDEAIAAARQSGFVRYEALANEAAARYHRAQGQEKLGELYAREARACYARWGATAKLRAMDAEWPQGRSSMPGAGTTEFASDHVHLGLVPALVEKGQLDLATVWKATQALSGEATRGRLLGRLMDIVKEGAGAQRAVLILQDDTDVLVQAESMELGEPRLLQGEPLDSFPGLPVGLVRYVLRSQTAVLLEDASAQGAYTRDPYVEAHRPRSVLALPLVHQGVVLGVLYLENRLVSGAFTAERLSVLQIVAGQTAVSLQNLRAAERAAYMEAERAVQDRHGAELEARVEARTAELKHAYEQLKELGRLKTDFLNMVSHELRTPLTSIMGFTEFLEDGIGGTLTAEQLDYVHQIQQGTVQLRRLVDDLLDFAADEAGSLKLVRTRTDLRQVVDDALDVLGPLLHDKGLTLELELPERPVWVEADAGRVGQVLFNLVGNAVKFTPRGGRIRVSLAELPDALQVEVTDTGAGIAPEHLPKLFEKFYQVDSSTTREEGGVGLGLSIAHAIVKAHGGTIGVRSTLGEGSTFWFNLPLTGPRERSPGSA